MKPGPPVLGQVEREEPGNAGVTFTECPPSAIYSSRQPWKVGLVPSWGRDSVKRLV